MAKANNINNEWVLSQVISASGSTEKTFDTAGTFIDKNIKVETIVPGGSYSLTTTASGTITPTVSISSGSTYGFTSGTLTGNYLTIDPDATVKSNWAANYSISGGFLSTQSGSITGTPTIETGQNYYVPIVTPTFTGGQISLTSYTNEVTTVPQVTINASGSFITQSAYGVTTTPPSGTDGTNYLTIDGTGSVTTTGKATANVKAEATSTVKYSNSGGVIAAHNNQDTGVRAVGTSLTPKEVSITPNIIDNFSPLYIPITSVTVPNSVGVGTNNTSNTISTNMAASGTTGSYYIDASAGGNAVSNSVAYSTGKGAIAQTNGIVQGSSTPFSISATRIYIKSLTATVSGSNTVNPQAAVNGTNVTLSSETNNGISVTATGGGTAEASANAVVNQAGYASGGTIGSNSSINGSLATTNDTKYITAVTVPANQGFSLTTNANTSANAACGTVTITNGNYHPMTVNNNSNGTITFNNSGTTNMTNRGTTNITSFNSGNGTVNINAYTSGTNTLTGNKSIVSNGRWVSQTVTAGTSTETYYGAITVNPASSITAASATITLGGTATTPTIARDNSNTSISGALLDTTTTKPNSGYYIAVKATAPATTPTRTVSINPTGFLSSSSQITFNGTIASATSSNYYIPVRGASGTINPSGQIGYLNINKITTGTNSGTATASNAITTTKPTGYYISLQPVGSGTASATRVVNTTGYLADANQLSVSSANINSTSGSIFYVPITSAAGAVSLTKGDGACDISTANNVEYAATNTYNNNISVTFAGSGTVSGTVNLTTAGYLGNANQITTSSTTSNPATSQKFITGVKLVAPSSGQSHFKLQIPNGSTTEWITWYFHCDSSGNVYIDDTAPS